MSEERDQVADEPIVDSAEAVADEAHAQGDDQDQPEEGALEANPDDETEEIEHEGKKYSVPKGIKPLLLMQKDYTQKTQEVAETRKAVEARQAEVRHQAELAQALREDLGAVHSLASQVKAFEELNWQALSSEDPASSQALWMQYQQTKTAHEKAVGELKTKEQTFSDAQRNNAAKQASETWATLTKDIKGWSEPVARQVVDYAGKEFGVTLEDLRTADHRSWKLLHTAMTATAELNALKAKDKTAARQEKVAGIEPAKTVGARAGGYKPGLNDELPADEWMRRRNAELAKKRA
jgi:hypothetical protein